MNKINIWMIITLFGLLLVAACKGNNDNGADKTLSPSAVIGTWNFQGSECVDNGIGFVGAQKITFSGSTGIAVNADDDCQREDSFDWTIDSNKLLISNRSTTCTPSNCTYTFIDGSSQPTEFGCSVETLDSAADSGSPVAIEGGTNLYLTRTVEDGQYRVKIQATDTDQPGEPTIGDCQILYSR